MLHTLAHAELKTPDNVIVHSLDYDRCFEALADELLNPNRKRSYLEVRILSEIKNNFVVIMNGSNRQDLRTDSFGRLQNKDNGSCFHFLVELQKQLINQLPPHLQKNLSLDTFLMPDLCHELKPGTTFEQAFKSTISYRWLSKQFLKKMFENHFTNAYYENPFFDFSKISLVYAQIHYLACKYPGKNIEYHFYDDSLSIYEATAYAFSKYPNLIPSTVKLHLHNYWPSEGMQKEPKYSKVIQGTEKFIGEKYIQNTNILFQELSKRDIENAMKRISWRGAAPIFLDNIINSAVCELTLSRSSLFKKINKEHKFCNEDSKNHSIAQLMLPKFGFHSVQKIQNGALGNRCYRGKLHK